MQFIDLGVLSFQDDLELSTLSKFWGPPPGIAVNQPDKTDGLDVLAKVGGFEIGGIAGCILAAAYCSRPVVIDGFISTAGALVAHTLCPTAVDYMFSGHQSEESGHGAMLRYLGLDPILDLGMRLGEGAGGALAMSIIEGAIRQYYLNVFLIIQFSLKTCKRWNLIALTKKRPSF